MTVLKSVIRKCAVCGRYSEQTIVQGPRAFGSRDLDTRPPESIRSTMEFWAQECPYCGYVADDLTETTTVDEGWLHSDEFIARANVDFIAPLAARFYRFHLINLADNNPGDAYLAALHAAWACDDCDDTEYADFCRQRVLEVLPWYRKLYPGDETALAIEADVLRRTGQFGQLLDTFGDWKASRPLLNILMDFQREKARSQDIRCYTVADAIRFRKMN